MQTHWHPLGRRSSHGPALGDVVREIVLVALLLWSADAGAQVNIENLRGRDPTGTVTTSIDLRLQYRSGNVELATLDLDARTDVTTKLARAFALVRGGIGFLAGDRFASEGLAHVRLMRRAEHFGPETFVQADYDRSRKLDARYLGGVGFRLKLYEVDERTVAWGSAWMLEHERYDLDATAQHPSRTTAHRWSNYVVARRDFGSDASVSWIAYVQPRFDDFEDLRVLVDASVGVGITARLAMTTTFHMRYDSNPPDDIKDLDTSLAAGMQIVF